MSEEKYNIDEYPIEEELEEVMKLNKEQVKIIEDLQQKIEQLENIRKEAIEELSYMSTDAYVENYDIREKHYNLLMNILNKGDNNEKNE